MSMAADGEDDLPFPSERPHLRAVRPQAESKASGLPIENIGAFIERLADAPELVWHVDGLIPAEGICLWHGQPRDFKSLCALETSLAMATPRAPFGAERFVTRRAVKVAFFAEEDPERLFAERIRTMTATAAPPQAENFYPFIRKGLTIDDEFQRRSIIKAVIDCEAQVAVFDPLRSFTAFADKGPADFAPVTRFFRRLQNETQCKTILIVHHDTKPVVQVMNGNPERSRSQEASGGGIFSISECPVSFKKLAWNMVSVFPEDYKLTGNPSPFKVTFETDSYIDNNGAPRFGSWVRPSAETRGELAMKDDALRVKVLAFLAQIEADHGSKNDTSKMWVSASEVDTGAKLRKGRSLEILEQLHEEGLISKAEGKQAAKALGRKTTAVLWRGVKNAAPPAPSGGPEPRSVAASPSPNKGGAGPRLIRATREPAQVIPIRDSRPVDDDPYEEGS